MRNQLRVVSISEERAGMEQMMRVVVKGIEYLFILFHQMSFYIVGM